MSTNTPSNSYGQGPYGAPTPQGQPYGAQGQPFPPGQPAPQAGYFGPPRALISSKEAITNLVMCGIPIVIGFIALFLPYFSVEAGMYGSESVSWANAGSDGPFIFALIFLIVAIIPLGMQFIPRINPKQMLSASGLVTSAGIVLAINIAINLSPDGLDDTAAMEAYGITVSRGIGFWLLCVSAIALIATGILFTMRVKKAADNASRATSAFGGPYRGQVPGQGAQGYPGPGGTQQPFPAPGQQPPAQPWGGQNNQYGQQAPGQQSFGSQQGQGFPGQQGNSQPGNNGPLSNP